MAIVFVPGQVAVGDPSPTGPTPTSNVKDLLVKVVKLSSANFTTAGVNTLVAVLPADASIIGVFSYVKTALSGNGVTSPVISIGSTSGGTEFANAVGVTNTTGTYAAVTPVTAIVQAYGLPLPGDIPIFLRGICSTGNPTAGEIDLVIQYVR